MFHKIRLLLSLSPTPPPTTSPNTLPRTSSAPTNTSAASPSTSSASTALSNSQPNATPSPIQTTPSTLKREASAQSGPKSPKRTQNRYPCRQSRIASMAVASTSTSSNGMKSTSSTGRKSTQSAGLSKSSGSASTSSSNTPSTSSSSAKKFDFKEHPVEYLDDNFGANLYGCAFNQFLAPTETPVVALVGSKGTIAVYGVPQNSNPPFEPLYNGKLGKKEEKDLNTVTWCFDVSNKQHKIVCGEETGRIYVINASDMTCDNVLVGSQAAINDLRTHPTDGALVATAGDDCTVRIYHIRHESALVVCAGIHGHLQGVQTVTWSPDGYRLISGGNDQRILMWNVGEQEVQTHLEEKSRVLNQGKKLPLANLKDGVNPINIHGHTMNVPRPISTITDVHYSPIDYLDLQRKSGMDVIISKACAHDSNIQVWVMGSSTPENLRDGQMSRSRRIAATIPVASQNPWVDLWIRFAVDPLGDYIVASNSDSQLMFYDFTTGDKAPVYTIVLRDPAWPANLRMRQAKFSPDGKILLVVGDFAFMKRFDRL